MTFINLRINNHLWLVVTVGQHNSRVSFALKVVFNFIGPLDLITLAKMKVYQTYLLCARDFTGCFVFMMANNSSVSLGPGNHKFSFFFYRFSCSGNFNWDHSLNGLFDGYFSIIFFWFTLCSFLWLNNILFC